MGRRGAGVRALTLLGILSVGATAEEPVAPLAPRLLGPRSGPDRARALAAEGGNAGTEKAVVAGLDWLARHQAKDGSWDADAFDARCAPGGSRCEGKGKGQHGEEVPCPFDEAITGLSALAFLGAGHAPGTPDDPHAAVVERALRRLEHVRETWALPLATEALAEAAGLSPGGPWREACLAHAARLLAMRQPDGAWGYAAPWRKGSDVPFTAFVVAALVAAADVGATLPEDLGPGVDRWLTSLETSKGRLAYLLDARQYGYTPTTSNAHAAVAIRALLHVGLQGTRHQTHRALVLSEKPVWKISFKDLEVPGQGKVRVQVGNLSLYQWWLGTVGLFQEGGTGWREWFGAVKTALLAHQRTDGCARGSWDPLGTYERQTGGRVFATALAVLMLEQPYRHRRMPAAPRGTRPGG